MKKLANPIVAVLLMVALAVPVSALQGGGAKDQEVTGTIMKVDTASGAVTVQTSDGKTTALSVDSATKVSIGGKKGTIADLKDGQVAKLKLQGGKVVSIEI